MVDLSFSGIEMFGLSENCHQSTPCAKLTTYPIISPYSSTPMLPFLTVTPSPPFLLFLPYLLLALLASIITLLALTSHHVTCIIIQLVVCPMSIVVFIASMQAVPVTLLFRTSLILALLSSFLSPSLSPTPLRDGYSFVKPKFSWAFKRRLESGLNIP